MAMTHDYAVTEPLRDDVDAWQGATVLEFGAPWCPHCIGAQPLLEKAFASHTDVRHIKIEDGRGRRLGRSFKIKLWPTLVFIRDGVEVSRTVRPVEMEEIARGLAAIDVAG